ncbi:MAG: pantoate--beta-alanine ligase [Actinomycetota bacterium]
MLVIESVGSLRAELARVRSAGRRIEFVPTMGALHAGHLSLVERAKHEGGYVVFSIFVNPTQFGSEEDFAAYPRDRQGDELALRRAGVDLLFAPGNEQIYPAGTIRTRIDPGQLGEVLEGQYRPGHFAAVATVCGKLFNIVAPDRVFLGEKDAQQLAVLRQMVADLDLPVQIVACPTVREPDGLAMSSRNRLMDPEQRWAAAALPSALFAARDAVAAGEQSPEALVRVAVEVIQRQPLVRLQYLEVVDNRSFRPAAQLDDRSLMVLAALLGPVRLIDNLHVGTASGGLNGREL